jgi:hypoxanthine phosphoribosyltransferase
MSNKSQKVLITRGNIQQRVQELAKKINNDYSGKTLDIVCFVNSASFFCIDLIRELTIPTRLHYLSFTSYSTGNNVGEVKINLDVNEPLYGRDILVVEGIVVSGRTPKYVLDIFQQRKPASLNMCALGIKPKLLAVSLPLKYVAFELGSEIAVGYGIGNESQKTSPHLVELSA